MPTRFFHQMASGYRRQNHIRQIRVGDRVHRDQASMGQALVDHFRDFYHRGPPNQWNWTPTTISTISITQIHHLSRLFSAEEVKAAVWSLNSEGAPGPDGIPVFFYKECWDMLKPEVMRLMGDSHAGRCKMEQFNKVYLVLIPKVPGAEQIGDFRPIAFSNSIYLIIAKVLATRLRDVMDSLISPLQSDFIPGRQMLDSVVAAEEIVAAWRHSSTSDFLWKVDFTKAYDSVDWRYLWDVLRRRGFPEEWVRWMKLCVTISSCSVLINGQTQGGWFQPRMPTRTTTFYFSCGCPGFLYYEALLAWSFIGISDGRAPRGYIVTSVCGGHHVLHSGIGDDDPHPFSDDEHL